MHGSRYGHSYKALDTHFFRQARFRGNGGQPDRGRHPCSVGRQQADSGLYLFRLMGSSVVSVTFVVVLIFLGPLYGYGPMFSGVCFWLHLFAPVMGIAGQIACEPEKPMPVKSTFWALVPTFAYGCFYIGVNSAGWTGTADPKTDFYAFLRWGWAVGILMFMVVFLINWLAAFILTKRK